MLRRSSFIHVEGEHRLVIVALLYLYVLDLPGGRPNYGLQVRYVIGAEGPSGGQRFRRLGFSPLLVLHHEPARVLKNIEIRSVSVRRVQLADGPENRRFS